MVNYLFCKFKARRTVETLCTLIFKIYLLVDLKIPSK